VNKQPRVHVVVVDHDGGDLTLACLRSIVASEWPVDALRVVLVDNASRAPIIRSVTRDLSTIDVITSATNLGFAGGANLGLCERGDADYVALVNNDAIVTPGWLTPLVDALAHGPRVGAACPKILFATPTVEVELDAPTRVRGRGDRRPLGVRLSGARAAGVDVWTRTQLVDGFWGDEPMPPGEDGGQWTTARGVLRVPVADDRAAPPVAVLRLAGPSGLVVTARSGAATTQLRVGPIPAWHDVALGAEPVEVVNNVGTEIGPDGYGRDRGWLEVDRGQYDEPADVDAWCGAAVLLSRPYLDDVGLFDERLFLYYEDVELSQRGTRRGWRYRTAPRSVVRHVHSATSVARSPRAFHYNERNRLLVVGSTAPVGTVMTAFAHHLAVTASYAMRDVTAPLLRGSRPDATIVARRLRALGAAARMLPKMRRHPAPSAPPTLPR
jgi:GT2 family glycosyltransferase